jgi:NitT/TauT family transport system ATP-binding protein
VLTSRPARVKSVYKIDLPRPRVVGELRYDQRFIRIAQQLHEDLKEEVMKAREVIPA